MKFNTVMMYLGNSVKQSGKTGKSYSLAKFMDAETSEIYEFYVPGDKLALITEIANLKPFTPVTVVLELSSFNSKAQIDLSGVEGPKK